MKNIIQTPSGQCFQHDRKNVSFTVESIANRRMVNGKCLSHLGSKIAED